MSVSDRGAKNNFNAENSVESSFIPEFKEKNLKNILTSIIFIDKRKSIDPEMGSYISYSAAGLAAKEVVENGWHSEEMKENYLEAVSNLATIPMILTTTYVDPGITTMGLEEIVNNLLDSLKTTPFNITEEQKEAITSHETHETLGDIRDAIISIEEYNSLLPDDTAKIFTAGLKLSAKSIGADPLFETDPTVEALTKLVVMYNYISKLYSDYSRGDNPEGILKVVSDFNNSILSFFQTLPKLTRNFEADWLIPE